VLIDDTDYVSQLCGMPLCDASATNDESAGKPTHA